ncbi:MAG: 50S ribosomal protein L9 [Candidatus Wolfebacteria bacterium]|nr:50S ribosomal protein L9 [Candidatus Wolfebacteria bacterium]
MKVILLQNIKGLGEKYDIKDVSDGYGRNFLIPKNLAKFAGPRDIEEIKKLKAGQELEKEKTISELKNLATKLNGAEIEFYPKLGKNHEVYGSITKENIKTSIFEKFISDKNEKILNDIEIELKKPIRVIGSHQIEINLGFGIKTKISVRVSENH